MTYPATADTDGRELLAFTHRGTVVTMRGHNLRHVQRAIMSHTLLEIFERDDRPQAGDDKLPVIEEVRVAQLNLPPELREHLPK